MWFNLDDDDQKLITALVDKMPASDLATADPLAVKLHALHSRITDFKAEQANYGAYRSAVNTSDELECDEDATVSPGGDPGAWVHTWTWVTNEEAGIKEELDELDAPPPAD